MKLEIVDSRVAQNELDKNAMGGTELQGKWLTEHVSADLLDKVQVIRSRVRDLEKGKKHVLWLHDLPWDPESAHLKDPESRARFDKLVFVSNWQMQMYNSYLGVPYSESLVIRNAIYPIPKEMMENKPLDKVKLIYHPTPHRGLEILVPVFKKLYEEFPFIELDVFSSFKLYGWEERDQQYAALFEECKNHPAINYHGSQPNDVVRKALAKAHIFAYPSIWMETSCICAMEAMSAGCHIVCPNLAALPETTAGFATLYQWDEDNNRHAQKFYQELRHTIYRIKQLQDAGVYQPEMFQKVYADELYGWHNRNEEWTRLLQSL